MDEIKRKRGRIIIVNNALGSSTLTTAAGMTTIEIEIITVITIEIEIEDTVAVTEVVIEAVTGVVIEAVTGVVIEIEIVVIEKEIVAVVAAIRELPPLPLPLLRPRLVVCGSR